GPLEPQRVTLSRNGRPAEAWLTWQRRAGGLGRPAPPVEIAFRTQGGRLMPADRSPLIVFFPTEKETFLGFLVQGPYRTTPARHTGPGPDRANRVLVGETAALLCDVLRWLRDASLLTVDVLTALPLDEARFAAGSMFRPLFEAVRDLLTAEPLIPVAGGGYGVAVGPAPARAGGQGLLPPRQLARP